MKNYKRLTAADRGAIAILLQQHFTPAEIARETGFNRSTICREINNRSTPNGYFANIAHLDYQDKRYKRTSKLNYSKTRNYVLTRLMCGWTPEQIAGRMNLEGRSDRICHETIYRFIYSDEYCKQGKIYQYLPFAKKRRVSWKGRKTHTGKIPNRVSIHRRPGTKGEFGHWEGDSVIYTNKKAITTLNELKTGYLVFTRLEQKTAELTKQAIIMGLKGRISNTLTVDNGIEFMQHEEISKQIGVNVYFCDPYSSWQRGSNENSNRLLRKYLPKKCNIDELRQEELEEIAEELNNIPRKRLSYRTPAEAYQQELNNLINSVALDVRI